MVNQTKASALSSLVISTSDTVSVINSETYQGAVGAVSTSVYTTGKLETGQHQLETKMKKLPRY